MLLDASDMLMLKRDAMPEYAGWVWPASLFCAIFVTVTVLIRIWSRLINRRSQPFGLDDWIAVAAWPFICAMYVLWMLCMRSGIGVHTSELSDEQYSEASKLLIASFVVYYMCGDLIRVSLTLYYIRLFSTSKNFKRFAWVNIALNVAWQISGSVAVCFQCSNPESIWDLTIKSHCIRPIEHQYYCGISSTCLDIIALLLPVPMIWKLQLKPSKKRELLALFFVSYLAPIFTITRLARTLSRTSDLDDDPMYYYTTVLDWAILEIFFGYLGICVPAFLYLSRRWYQRGFLELFNGRNVSQKGISGGSSSLRDNSTLGRDSSSFTVSEVSASHKAASFSSLEDLAHPMSILHTRTYTVTSEDARA